jgi:cation diffusion facilitator CzcD-associated flavoprotein CzcO
MIRTTIFKMFSTHTRFCIIGGGTGGLNLSTHMLRAKVDPKDIRIFDAS